MLRYMYTACLFRNCKFRLKQVQVTSVCLPRQEVDGKSVSCTKRQRQIRTRSEALHSQIRHSQMHAGCSCFHVIVRLGERPFANVSCCPVLLLHFALILLRMTSTENNQ